MPAKPLKIKNRKAYLRKSISTPKFDTDRVLTRDAFDFGSVWLQQNCADAIPFWSQAHSYYLASQNLPTNSSPLTSYYCFLNATKALLHCKGVSFSEQHGVSGDFSASKRTLSNETISIFEKGVLGSLSKHLNEKEKEKTHTLKEVLSNLPFIHRAYRYTYVSEKELFIPLRDVFYRKNPNDNYVWISASIAGRYADGRSSRTLPKSFEVDEGFAAQAESSSNNHKKGVEIRLKQKVKWIGQSSNSEEQERANSRLFHYHRKARKDLVYISASPTLWYLKRDVAGTRRLDRYGLTLIMAAMHRLSELSRYDPQGLNKYLEGKEAWLVSEFIKLAPNQFIDELLCEMTSLELSLPGVRPSNI